ncbi:ICMT-domain-containing protein [Gloeophyllum trabeum ATCC 11539]|uniref:Protein-S-isoprenylcysteine O-methyltransferase n=1 Tax=Gloeophyllum trabeum (strain ATCC 11539 / FP-39264 / Madison 617) TaxID=670483 RepID=S7S1K4_GLOTA|nr:ICMT-domain-containing protein [Gloeophyllum trabeum ATCC 11539]EPQ61335.1 ICMT-domain-containing protein [Gloeophyllum trabeum ATCC 11539]
MSNLLLKVPLLITASGCFQLSITPPTPVPSEQELVAPASFGEKVLNSGRGFGPVVPKILSWAVSVAEILTILALTDKLPASTPPVILQYLAPNRPIDSVGLGITPTFLAGWLLTVAGGAVRYWCYRTLGRMFTYQLSIRKDHRLVTSGPYAFVRHPSYTGLLLVAAGINLLLFSRGSWVRESGVLGTPAGKAWLVNWVGVNTAWPMVIGRAPREDEMMKRQFGKEWEEWAARVPYKLIPWVY